ncbi:uncharacterized protein LOC111037205 [Myzus persicae]|uniref:uncharacterized protein LOC111037205 n=1 Tax=Myzus persicae TaxID=13164 RepID=UPI000B936B56|nr:uncharacterized protein LOC111037205 [Myzus persicae]
MVCPSNSGSNYYNHKGTFSIVLLALVGHNYNFSFIDIGSYGSNSDAGIFAKSALKRALEENKLDMIPESVILGEEAFLLQTYLMTPFARRNILTKREKIYNYRHCRARRIVENAFGIFRQPIPLSPDKTIKLVKAAFDIEDTETGSLIEGSWRNYPKPSGLLNLTPIQRNYATATNQKKNYLADYFVEEGAVDWQNRMIE